MANNLWQAILALTLAAGLTACVASEIPLAKSTTGRNPTVAEVPDANETVRGDQDPAIVTLDLNSTLHEHRLGIDDELPGNIIIPTTNLNAVPVTAALQAVLTGTDVALSWNTGSFGSRLVSVMNLSGPLPKVVQKICAAAKVFCDYRNGTLELSEKETFVVALPPVAHAVSASTESSSSSSGGGSVGASSGGGGTNSMVEAISGLLDKGEKAQVDDQGGNIIYVASVDAENRVSQYLAQLRTGRPLVVLQMYIWEVELDRENQEGINWSQLNANIGSKSITPSLTDSITSAAGAAGSVSLGAVTSGIISANVVASFLATKGRLQTISNPQVTFVSGTSAELKVGGTTNYISQVGTLTNATNVAGTGASSNSNTNSATNTVSTASIDTGLTIDVAGAYENGVVFASLAVSLKNLVGLNPTPSSGGTIDLPQTTDERMNTVLRVRPGDSLVLAGLVTSADTQQSQGLPTGSDSAIPMYGDNKRQNHELVIIVKPSVVLFSDQPSGADAQKKQNLKPLPDALVIDKNGTRKLALPQQPAPAAAAAPRAAALKPELMASEPKAVSVASAPPSSGNDGAPVDQLLMQRGFSRAFNQLLQPAGGSQ